MLNHYQVDQLEIEIPQLILALEVLELLNSACRQALDRKEPFVEPPTEKNPNELNLESCLCKLAEEEVDLEIYQRRIYYDAFRFSLEANLTLLKANASRLEGITLNITALFEKEAQALDEEDDTPDKESDILDLNELVMWYEHYFNSFINKRITRGMLT